MTQKETGKPGEKFAYPSNFVFANGGKAAKTPPQSVAALDRNASLRERVEKLLSKLQ